MDVRWEIIDQTDIIAGYLLKKLKQNLKRGSTTNVDFPENWSPEFLSECDQAAHILARAYVNQGKFRSIMVAQMTQTSVIIEQTVWKAEEYANKLTTRCTGQNEQVEEEMQRLFRPIHDETRLEVQPMVVTDSEGNIMLWYLPGILTAARKVSCLCIHN